MTEKARLSVMSPKRTAKIPSPRGIDQEVKVGGITIKPFRLIAPAVEYVSVKNATVHITPWGAHVLDGDTEVPDINLVSPWNSKSLEDIEPPQGEAIILEGRWSYMLPPRGRRNFCHFILEGLPNAYHDAIYDLPLIDGVISETGMEKLTTETFAIFGEKKVTFAGSFAHYKLEEFSFLKGLKHPANGCDPKIMSLYSEQSAHYIRHSGSFEKIAILRKKGRRGVHNEAEVMELLARHGYACIDPAAHSLSEQIEMFATAHEIVAVHGAALALLAFVKAPAKVVELCLADYFTPAFWIMGGSMGLDYALLPCSNANVNGVQPKFWDLNVPLSELEALL